MHDLLVIDVRVKDGKGHVILADRAGDPLAGRHIVLEFPIGRDPEGSYPEREAELVAGAKAVLEEASAALDAR